MIHKKLLEFQKKGITLKKDGTNPHFRSSYVTLNEVLDKVKKPLNDLGIIIVQTPERDGLNTYLIDTEESLVIPPTENSDVFGHTSAVPNEGAFIQSFVPYINATDMQKLGGAITYARRYALIAMLGLEDEDDDGTAATKAPVSHKKAPTSPVQMNEAPDLTNDYKI